jgi:hypothetical protein
MSPTRIAVLALAGLATASLPAWSASPPRQDRESAVIERLNEESLRRARAGQDALTPGTDTTRDLNRRSEDAARQGQEMPRPPMPFR